MRPEDVQPGDIVWNMFAGSHGRIVVVSPPQREPSGTITFLSNRGRERYSPETPLVPDYLAQEQIAETVQHYRDRELDPGERDVYRGALELQSQLRDKEAGE